MQIAQYPERKCKEPVFNDYSMAYSCELVDLHPGPHASLSVKRTVEARDRWESDHPEWRGDIGDLDTIV